MVGRTLWFEPAARWLRGEIDDDALASTVAANFVALADAWRASRPPAPARATAAFASLAGAHALPSARQ